MSYVIERRYHPNLYQQRTTFERLGTELGNTLGLNDGTADGIEDGCDEGVSVRMIALFLLFSIPISMHRPMMTEAKTNPAMYNRCRLKKFV